MLKSWFTLFDSKQTKNIESTESQKTSFRKEILQNAGIHKPVLNKITTKQEKWVKYDFVAPLKLLKKHEVVYS